MFRGFFGRLIQFSLVIIFGLVTFIPNYGIVFLAYNNFSVAPIPIAIFIAFWSMLLFLLLPMALKHFQRISSLCLFIIFGIIFYASMERGLLSINDLTLLAGYGIVVVFSIIGWYMVSVPLWRTLHSVVAVQQTDTVEEHHQN